MPDILGTIKSVLKGGAKAAIDHVLGKDTAAATEAKSKIDEMELEQDHQYRMLVTQLESDIQKAEVDHAASSRADQAAINMESVKRGFSWRDGIGWVMVAALAMKFVLAPITFLGLDATSIDTSALWPVLMGMLGLGGMRTAEKIAVFKNGNSHG